MDDPDGEVSPQTWFRLALDLCLTAVVASGGATCAKLNFLNVHIIKIIMLTKYIFKVQNPFLSASSTTADMCIAFQITGVAMP